MGEGRQTGDVISIIITMAQKLTGGKLTFQNPVLGGISDSQYLGKANSFYKIVGLDIFSTPGLILPAQGMKTLATIDEHSRFSIYATNGYLYVFSYTSGKIWEVTPGTEAVALVHTTVPTSGAVNCRGVCEYNGYLYWATESYLHRIPIGNAHVASWSTGLAQNWQAIAGHDPHVMAEVNGILYISTGNTIAQVDNATYTAAKLTLPYGYYANSLAKSGTDLVVGGVYASQAKVAEVFVWNTYSKSFSFSDPIQDHDITAMIEFDNTVLIFAGKSGRVYYLNGTKAELYMTLPYRTQPYPNFVIYPDAVCVYRDRLFVGVSDHSGAGVAGVYVIGQSAAGYPKVIAHQFPLNTASTISKIYSIKTSDVGNQFNLFAAYYDPLSTTYRCDKTDQSNRYTSSYIETKLIFPDYYNLSKLRYGWADYEGTIPANTSLDMLVKVNHGTTYTINGVIDTMRARVDFDLGSMEAKVARVKLQFNSSANAYPAIHQFGIKLD